MTGLERTLSFLNGDHTDRIPFHPIIMRWAAKYAGIRYRDFCLDPISKCRAMIMCAKDFDIDWVTVMSDPWAEASAFGIKIEYPENNLPVDISGHLPDALTASKLKQYNPLENLRCKNRLKEIKEFKKQSDNEVFIVGWVEGPVAEYVDLRKAVDASFDFYDDPVSVGKTMDVITESSLKFISLQIKEGANCIGIGDAFCSQIGPELYNEFAFERQKILVDHIHNMGALAKLHICGNTKAILPRMIATGADIIDIDHLVPSMSDFAALLQHHQVFSGKADPVSIIQDGSPALIIKTVKDDFASAGKKCIISAGCEITPDTSIENMKIFSQVSKNLINY